MYLHKYCYCSAQLPAIVLAHVAHYHYTQVLPSTSQQLHHKASFGVRQVASQNCAQMLRHLSQVLSIDSCTLSMARYAVNGVSNTDSTGNKLSPHTPTYIAFFVSSLAVTHG